MKLVLLSCSSQVNSDSPHWPEQVRVETLHGLFASRRSVFLRVANYFLFRAKWINVLDSKTIILEQLLYSFIWYQFWTKIVSQKFTTGSTFHNETISQNLILSSKSCQKRTAIKLDPKINSWINSFYYLHTSWSEDWNFSIVQLNLKPIGRNEIKLFTNRHGL